VALAQNQLAGFTEAVLAHGGKTLALAVSGGFHSPFMAEAKTGLDKALSKIACQAPVLPIYANSTALPYEASEAAIKETVARQVMQPVQWQGSIENMLAVGVDTFIEVGPGKTLTNLIKKISPGAAAFNVEDSASLLAAAAHCSHRAG
jgi:[acyl-carrier-protein] S-malonyltransferase